MTIKPIKKYLIFGLLFLIAGTGIITRLVHYPDNSSLIIPGESNIKTILQSTTQPFSTQNEGDITKYLVGTPSSSNYTEYVAQNNTLSYYIQKNPADFPHPKLPEYITDYGSVDIELYGPWYQAGGYKSYVFLQPGIVIIAHPVSKDVTEIWHISPHLTSDQFLTSFGTQFSKSTPKPVEAF